MADKVTLEVPADLDGARVDKAIAGLFDVSRARAAAIVGAGVVLDGEPASASDRVRAGQALECDRPTAVLRLQPEVVDFGVLHLDAHVIVVNKPAGLVVHPGSGNQRGTLAAGLIERFPELVGVGASDRWGLVHRLDKDTSGALLVARTGAAFDDLVAQLRERRIGRRYRSLVEGLMGAPTGTIDAPIGRDAARPTRRAVTHGGKHARTHYVLVEEFDSVGASLLDVRLETGRTHQIRVHLAAIGHPVAGDRTYGATRKDLGAPRTFLHAVELEFDHPGSGERMSVEAPLPDDLVGVLADLRAGQ